MTLTSIVGHCVAFIILLFLSWYQPLPKLKLPSRPKVNVQLFQRTPPPKTPKKTAARVVTPTPKPKTPEPKKTVVKTPKKTPTPSPAKKRTPKPTPKKTKTPTPTKRLTPKLTPRKTPKPTPAPTPRKPAPTPKVTQPPAPTPAREVEFQQSPLSDFPFYEEALKQKLIANFTLERHLRAANVTCDVAFRVMRDGTIKNVRVVRSTGDDVLDRYALRAFDRAGRFGPFPDSLRKPYIDKLATFDYSPKD